MTTTFFGTRSRATTTEDEVVPSQAEIDREIAKLKEDSDRDVQQQLEKQRKAARMDEVEEDIKKVAEDAEDRLSPVWKAAEQEVVTIIKDTEADVRHVRRLGERGERTEKGEH